MGEIYVVQEPSSFFLPRAIYSVLKVNRANSLGSRKKSSLFL